MTTLKRVLEIEANGGDNIIHLHRSGIFLEAFNRSALLLLRHCKVSYKLNYKFSAELNQGFGSVGFPQKSLPTLFGDDELMADGSGYQVETTCSVTDDEVTAFIERAKAEKELRDKEKAEKEKTPTPASAEAKSSEDPVTTDAPPPFAKTANSHYPGATKEILARLRHFDIVNQTPMECMLLVNKLKKLLNS